MIDPHDTSRRFDRTITDYVRFRPGYPKAVLDAVHSHWMSSDRGASSPYVADIGAGTGIMTRQMLEREWKVVAIEPNPYMLREIEKLKSDFPSLVTRQAFAENTTLPDASLDGILAAHSFHWFRRAEFLAEARRTLKPGGWVALVWNERDTATPFNRALEEMLRQEIEEYRTLNMRHRLNEIERQELFEAGGLAAAFPNIQTLDREQLHGRIRSMSFLPEEETAREQLFGRLDELFEIHQNDGIVSLYYTTWLYHGEPAHDGPQRGPFQIN